MKHNCKIDYMRNNCWPQPFLESDASQVRNAFTMMKNNGWRLHHTLSHEVFREEDNVLTAVGRNRLHWISTQSPEHRRVVYVLEGETREITQKRVKSVNEALTYITSNGGLPQVLVTHKIPSQASGEWNRNLSVSRVENMPPAALPTDEGGGGGEE